MSVRTYDPKAVSVVVGGVPIHGFADGTFIHLERSTDAFSKVVGTDGIVSRAKSNDQSGQLTITLAQTSPSNDALYAFAILDQATATGIVPIFIKDNSGRSTHFSALAWVRKMPPLDYAKEISNREWIFDLADYDEFPGGNADFEPAT